MSRWSADDDDRWLDGERPNTECTDCGDLFARAAIDVRTICDACCDRRDAWASALELTMVRAELPIARPGVLEVAIVPVDPAAPLSAVLDVRLEPAGTAGAVRRPTGEPIVTIREKADRFASLQTLSAVQASRVGKSFWKGKTRIEAYVDERPIVKVNDRTFKRAVWARDRYRCRACERQVLRTVARVPERGEVHHLAGRIGDLRFEIRSALLLCLRDHERVTGRVNEHRLTIAGSQTFTIQQGTYIDATHPVVFKRAA